MEDPSCAGKCGNFGDPGGVNIGKNSGMEISVGEDVDNDTDPSVQRVAIIGAGASGLCCAWRFTEPKVKAKFKIVVYEQTDRIGGTWVYTPQVGIDPETGLPIHSSMYENLRTNLPKECMKYPGFEYGKHLNKQSYLSWSEVLRYLEEFSNHFDLKQYICFHHVVLSVTRRHDKWKVRVKDLKIDASFEEEYDVVIVCNGHNSVPNMPTYEGMGLFKGVQIHSHDYRVPEPFRNQNVLVVGFGPSGVDIGIDIERVAKQVYLSHHIQVAFKHQIGDAIIQKPDVKQILEDSVIFQDDTIQRIDSIIYCTGYKFDFDCLTPSCGLHEDLGMLGPFPLYKMLINCTIPSMAFIGVPGTTIIFPLFDVQVQFFLKCLLGEIKLPDTTAMLNEYEEEIKEKQSRGLRKKHFHILAENMEKYLSDLNHLANGTLPVPRAILEIYRHSGQERKKFNFKKYRNFVYTIIDDDHFEFYEREESQL
uniref:Flavin-containing monooxygenase n=1 Tax=Cacopsylla melanoneura TaxID=428564 RepID=A0A8D8XFU7_9HEMI